MADNINNSSDFFSRITEDVDIPKEDVQKYILATSDFAKSIQTDINHYVTRDRIKDASFSQRLDTISKNILRRQNPLELVFEDISTFNAKSPIVGSLLREMDIKKKQSDSGFIKSLPSHPGKEFEIKKRLDKLRGINNSNNNNNNNNNNINNLNLFGPGPGGDPPSLPRIEDFLDNSRPPPPPPPSAPSITLGENLFKAPPIFPSPANEFDVNAKIRTTRPNFSTYGIRNDLFGSQVASAIRENKTKTQEEVDDFLYELPETMPDLELGDKLVNALGTEAQSLFDKVSLTKKEEKNEVLKNLMEEYDIKNIRDTMDETAQVPESIYFFYGGDSDEFVKDLEFIGQSPINR